MSADEYTQEDRRKCEIRLHKRLAWVGTQYPENLDVQGKNIKIREFIFDLITKNRLSSKDLKEIKILLHILQEIKLRKEKELETLKLTISEGRQLCDEIAGLIRAVDTLKDLLKMREKGEFYRKSKENRIRREKRWIKYLENLKKWKYDHIKREVNFFASGKVTIREVNDIEEGKRLVNSILAMAAQKQMLKEL